MGKQFNMSPSSIRLIARGIHWKDSPVRKGICVSTSNAESFNPVKLTIEDANTIREKHNEGISNKELAIEYGVDPSNISLIVRGKIWK